MIVRFPKHICVTRPPWTAVPIVLRYSWYLNRIGNIFWTHEVSQISSKTINSSKMLLKVYSPHNCWLTSKLFHDLTSVAITPVIPLVKLNTIKVWEWTNNNMIGCYPFIIFQQTWLVVTHLLSFNKHDWLLPIYYLSTNMIGCYPFIIFQQTWLVVTHLLSFNKHDWLLPIYYLSTNMIGYYPFIIFQQTWLVVTHLLSFNKHDWLLPIYYLSTNMIGCYPFIIFQQAWLVVTHLLSFNKHDWLLPIYHLTTELSFKLQKRSLQNKYM